MLHPSAERLAALVESEPTAAEAAHLRQCLYCTSELAEYQRLVACAGTLVSEPGIPITAWGNLAERLKSEGLIRSQGSEIAVLESSRGGDGMRRDEMRNVVPLTARRSPAVAGQRVLRAAAVILVVGGSMVLGRVSAGAAALPGLASNDEPGTVTTADVRPLTSSDDALTLLERAERDYRAATTFLAMNDTSARPLADADAYHTRLATLDEVAAVTRAALYDSPGDPVINQYYLTSLGAREATIQQLGTMLPYGTQINRF